MHTCDVSFGQLQHTSTFTCLNTKGGILGKKILRGDHFVNVYFRTLSRFHDWCACFRPVLFLAHFVCTLFVTCVMCFRSDSEIDDTSSEDSLQPKKTYKGRLQDLIGRVLCMEIEDRKKTLWVPVLVVQPSADDMDLKSRDHLLVKSFKDSKL